MGIDEFVFQKIHGKNIPLEELQDNLHLFDSLVADIVIDNGVTQILEQRVKVQNVDGILIFVHPNDHSPPHFHIKSNSEEASLRIDNCEILNGSISPKNYRKLKYWYLHEGKEHVIQFWNNFRPSNTKNPIKES